MSSMTYRSVDEYFEYLLTSGVRWKAMVRCTNLSPPCVHCVGNWVAK